MTWRLRHIDGPGNLLLNVIAYQVAWRKLTKTSRAALLALAEDPGYPVHALSVKALRAHGLVDEHNQVTEVGMRVVQHRPVETETSMADYAKARELGQMRPLRNVQLGWWVESFDDDGVSTFDRVVRVMHGKIPATGLPVVELLMQDHADPDHAWQLTDRADEPVFCLKAKEAKRAGLVEVVKSDG